MRHFECFQPRCGTDEFDQLWCVEQDLIEEGYRQLVESRDIDVGHKVLQVFANPFKQNICEDGED